MRSFLIKSSLVTAFLILFLLTSGIALAVVAPFLPGNILFPIQIFSEQKATLIYTDPVGRSSYSLDLLERRILNLSARAGTNHELIALEYLNHAVDQATLAISQVSAESL